jgi:hypothetical protein
MIGELLALVIVLLLIAGGVTAFDDYIGPK